MSPSARLNCRAYAETTVSAGLKDEGNAKVRAGQWDEAAKLYKKALKITPLEVPLLTNLAQVRRLVLA